MKKAEYKIPDGKLVATEFDLIEDKLTNVKIYGDFFMHPEESINDLERALNLSPKSKVEKRVRTFFKDNEVILVGISPEDFVRVITLALEN